MTGLFTSMRSQGLGTDHLSAKDVVQRSPCSAGTISAEIWMNSVDYERRSNFWYQLYRFEICSPFFSIGVSFQSQAFNQAHKGKIILKQNVAQGAFVD